MKQIPEPINSRRPKGNRYEPHSPAAEAPTRHVAPVPPPGIETASLPRSPATVREEISAQAPSLRA